MMRMVLKPPDMPNDAASVPNEPNSLVNDLARASRREVVHSQAVSLRELA